jgi:hypothetical protein
MNEPSKDGLRLQEMARILKEIQPDRTLLGSISEFYSRSLVARAIAFDFEPMSEIANRLSPSFFEEYPSFSSQRNQRIPQRFSSMITAALICKRLNKPFIPASIHSCA